MGAQNIVKEIKQYQKKWLQYEQRMDTDGLPKQALQYKPKGRRNIGQPRKRWRDQLHLEETRLTLQEHDNDERFQISERLFFNFWAESDSC